MNGTGGETVTGQEAGGTGRCSGEFFWPIAVEATTEIIMASRKTVISRSSLLGVLRNYSEATERRS